MKLNKYSLALILGFATLSSCSDRLELLNPNQQTSSTFGFNADDLEEKIPELVYLYRLKALLAHRDWERSAFKNGGDPKAVSILPFAQSLDFETDSVLKTMVENSYSGGSFFGSLNENGTIPGNERPYNRALDSYRRILR